MGIHKSVCNGCPCCMDPIIFGNMDIYSDIHSDIHIGHSYRISQSYIHIGYPNRTSISDIPIVYPYRISLSYIHIGYPFGYPYRISIWISIWISIRMYVWILMDINARTCCRFLNQGGKINPHWLDCSSTRSELTTSSVKVPVIA